MKTITLFEDNTNGRYENLIKSSSRGWIWNQLLKRLPQAKIARQECRIFTLIGDTTKELEVACKKGFSPFNVIGVDLKKQSVQKWRDAGGIAVQLPLDLAVMASKVKPHAVICDFCGGITATNILTLWLCFMRLHAPGALVVNMLRGRDPDVHKIRNWQLEVVARHLGLNSLHRGHLVYVSMLVDAWTCEDDINLHDEMDFSDFVNLMNNIYDPAFQTYKSADGHNQMFDTMVLSMSKNLEAGFDYTASEIEKGIRPPDEEASQLLDDRLTKSREPKVTRRMAALEAVRTKAIKENNGKLTKVMRFPC